MRLRKQLSWPLLSVLGLASLVALPVFAQATDDDDPAPKTSKPAPTKKPAKAPAKTTKANPPAKPRRGTPAKTTKAAAATKVPAIFYDEEWSYRTATLYDKTKNIVSGVSGEAKFERNGKFRQDYYIGSIGNFYKGTYKINGDRLTTFDEKGKKVFDFRFTVGTNPPILVLSLLEKDGSKSIDYSLVPLEKKKN